MKKHNAIIILLAGLILIGMFALQGCSNKLKGTENPNQAPSIYWADVTIDSAYSSNPNLRWFSTDQDGLVIDYDYCVMLQATVDSLGGPAAIASSFPTDRQWSITHSDSSTIQLYASSDTSVYVPQYVFLRAMDDDSSYSTIIYKYLSRNNHAPTCYLILPTGAQWCLPETTTAWKGIRVAWVGKDSIDITGLQPDFQWNIRVYGPFETAPNQWDTLGSYRQWSNTLTGEPWIQKKELYLTNLVTGFYLMYATCRDDAFVSAIPATGVIEAYEPTWIRHPELTKPILFANHSVFAYPGQPLPRGDVRQAYADSVKQFYINLVQDAGYTSEDYDWVAYAVRDSAHPISVYDLDVPKTDLYNHQLVIILNLDQWNPISASQQKAYN